MTEAGTAAREEAQSKQLGKETRRMRETSEKAAECGSSKGAGREHENVDERDITCMRVGSSGDAPVANRRWACIFNKVSYPRAVLSV